MTAPPESMTAASNPADPTDVVTLSPRFLVPLGVVVLGATCLLLLPYWSGAPWLAAVVVLFGGFLAVQAALLRLRFTAGELLVLRRENVIRSFPYDEWIGWRLYWPAVPVLFYFREQRSIHLLPMLFDATALQEQLQQRMAHLSSTPPR
jgi:hypothetical protein